MKTILSPNNREWGFFGTLNSGIGYYTKGSKLIWKTAFVSIMKNSTLSPEDIRYFLDSSYGRHLADEVIEKARTKKYITCDERDYVTKIQLERIIKIVQDTFKPKKIKTIEAGVKELVAEMME